MSSTERSSSSLFKDILGLNNRRNVSANVHELKVFSILHHVVYIGHLHLCLQEKQSVKCLKGL